MAAGRPGLLTRTGLHTFVDPRYGGGKQSKRTTEDLIKLVTIDGEEFLLYRSFPIDVAIIRGTTADERGNISMEDEAFLGENFPLAAAAHLRGGIVIVQVQRLAAACSLDAKQVEVPGTLVDYVVVAPGQSSIAARRAITLRMSSGRGRISLSGTRNRPAYAALKAVR